MKHVSPAVYDLVRWLLAQEEMQNDVSEQHPALRALEKLRLHLVKLVGVAGFQSLLSRALALAKADILWLEPVQVNQDGFLEGFNETALKQAAGEVTRGGTALLARLLDLLITFIGEALTLRLLSNVWPDASPPQMNTSPPHISSDQKEIIS